ncbi:MAG: hypothetical protein BV456_07410 [Thermoplasmata archaeon M8B2D]|nr:MAG: hypothetical protein BV456_07410 [Thermoplasmata archaeon M8B2D]
MKKMLSLLIIAIFLTNIGQADIAKTNADSDWVIMFYFNGDNKLSDSMQTEINIIKNVRSTDEIKFAILSDSDEIGDTKLYYVIGNNLIEQDWPEESDMDNPDTIVDFVQKVKTDYPAENYCLIPYSNKGAGWQGICYDQNGDGTMITMPELLNALSTVTNNGVNKLAVLFAQSCLCGNLEFRYQIRSYVEYTVGYADCGLSGDLPYEDILTELTDDSSMTSKDFATLIVDLFEPANLPFYKIVQSMGAAQSDKLDDLATAIDDLALFFIDNIDEYKTDIQTAWEDTRKYGITWDIDYFIDLQHFLELLTIDNQEFSNIKTNIISKINDAIIAKAIVEGDHSVGFNLYFPGRKLDYNLALRYDDGVLPSEYEETQFAINTNWDEFIKMYLGIGLNSPPEKPNINGPSSGKAGTAYNFDFCSSDQDGDNLTYCIDWGDESGELCLGPYPSNTRITESHTWTSDGTYTIKAKARDVNQAESDWATFSVTMPKNKIKYQLNILFERFLYRFPFMEKIFDQIP